ncbi:MAG: MAPEG family protein [Dokdonella sp.]|uniref:MAPEG family protein n=1 Tax=Dokdonella sp. TaxID=2291710 RepID=UPI003265706E
MTIAEWCLFAAVLVFLLTIAPFKPLGWREFDNARPRDPGFWSTPMRQRALGAHHNGIETFPFFAVAVLLAEFRHVPQPTIDALAVAFVVTRMAFVAAYLADFAWTRTAIWNIGFAINVALFFSPWWSK